MAGRSALFRPIQPLYIKFGELIEADLNGLRRIVMGADGLQTKKQQVTETLLPSSWFMI
jgi:hypothetical protein